jgi:hypothetical protein
MDLVIGPATPFWPALCRFLRRLSIAGRPAARDFRRCRY